MCSKFTNTQKFVLDSYKIEIKKQFLYIKPKKKVWSCLLNRKNNCVYIIHKMQIVIYKDDCEGEKKKYYRKKGPETPGKNILFFFYKYPEAGFFI